MKKIISLIITAILLLGCSIDSKVNANKEGYLILKLDSEMSRTLEPSLLMDISTFDITATGPDTERFTLTGTTETVIVKNNLAVGVWSMTVNAKNAEGTIIASATEAFTITDSVTTDLNVVVTPITGKGSLSIDFSWPENEITTPVISATLTSMDNTSTDLTFTVENNSAFFSNTELVTGYYTLNVQLLDDSEYVWGMIEAVRIIKDETSSATLVLTTDDLNLVVLPSGNLSLGITSDLQNPIDLAFTGNVDFLNVGEVMTVTVNPSIIPDSYEWYLNGQLISGENGATITTDNSLTEGKYKLDLIVKKNVISSSKSLSFHIVSLPTYPIVSVELGFEQDYLDLETGTVESSDGMMMAPDDSFDLKISYDSREAVHAVLCDEYEVKMLHLPNTNFEDVQQSDFLLSDLTVTTDYSLFDQDRVIIIQTKTGNIYKLGNGLETDHNTFIFDYQQIDYQ